MTQVPSYRLFKEKIDELYDYIDSKPPGYSINVDATIPMSGQTIDYTKYPHRDNGTFDPRYNWMSYDIAKETFTRILDETSSNPISISIKNLGQLNPGPKVDSPITINGYRITDATNFIRDVVRLPARGNYVGRFKVFGYLYIFVELAPGAGKYNYLSKAIDGYMQLVDGVFCYTSFNGTVGDLSVTFPNKGKTYMSFKILSFDKG